MKRKKKLKKKIKYLFLSIFILSFISLSINYTISYFSKDSYSFLIKNKESKKEDVVEEIWPKEYKIDLLATGDGLIHNLLAMYAEQSDGTYDFSDYLTEVEDIVKEYDIAYYNQETVFGGESIGYTYYPRFNTPSAYGDAMLEAGFHC